MTRKKVQWPTFDVGTIASITDELERAENELLDLNPEGQIHGLRRIRCIKERLREQIKSKIKDYELESGKDLPNKPKW